MNYQRILSYLYDYDRGVKRKNIGFVKIEIRGEICRVNIHMKLPAQLSAQLRVYFFFRRNDEVLGIPFADVIPVGNECDVRTMLPASFFDACGHAPDEFAGVYICQDDRPDMVFVSAWDDEPVFVETFRELKPAEPGKTAGSEDFEGSESLAEAGVLPEPETSARSQDIEGSESSAEAEVLPGAETPVGSKVLARPEEPAKPDILACPEDFADPAEAVETEESTEFIRLAGITKKPESMETCSSVELSVGAKVSESDEATAGAEMSESVGAIAGVKTSEPDEAIAGTEVSVSDGVTGAAKTSEPEEVTSGAEVSESVSEVSRENDISKAAVSGRTPWEELAKNFTKFRIVHGDTLVECLKIRPHHLALLPRRYWNDTNCSFLLHGYYSYGHIILARPEPGEEYYLGVPGKNRDRDRVMAGYYGYTRYLPAGRNNHSFGYWCKEITVSDSSAKS